MTACSSPTWEATSGSAALDGSGHRPIRALQGNLTGIAYAELPNGSPTMSTLPSTPEGTGRHRVVVIGSGFRGADRD